MGDNKGCRRDFYTKLRSEKSQSQGNQKPQNNLPKKDRVSQQAERNAGEQSAPKLAFSACLVVYSEGSQTGKVQNLTRGQVQASISTRDVGKLFAERWKALPHTSPPFPQSHATHFLSSLNLFICQLAPWKRLKGTACKKNHHFFHLRLTFYFSYNLLEPSWHFSPPLPIKTEREGWSMGIWCGRKRQSTNRAKPPMLAPPKAKR